MKFVRVYKFPTHHDCADFGHVLSYFNVTYILRSLENKGSNIHTHIYRQSLFYASLSCTNSISFFPSPISVNVGGVGLSAVGSHGSTLRGKFVTIWKSSGAASCTNTYVYNSWK